jgi:hypothetical protein
MNGFRAGSRASQRSAIVALGGILLSSGTFAKTLEVGLAKDIKLPSAAARMASDGDTIEISGGEYYDCAVWKANDLTILGTESDVIITDLSCQGKALFVTTGQNITIRNLTFARARVEDGNGAGIRAEGRNLTVERSRFINNESGILVADAADSTVTIRDSEFIRNGKCAARCAHAVYADRVAVLHIEHSKFSETKGGDAIRSRALRTELIGNEIEDGRDGTAAYLVEIPNGGSLVMRDNSLQKARPSGHESVVMLGSEDLTQASAELSFTRNRFVDDSGAISVFVMDWSDGRPSFEKNSLPPTVANVSMRGAWWHRFRSRVGGARDDILWLAGAAMRKIRSVL